MLEKFHIEQLHKSNKILYEVSKGINIHINNHNNNEIQQS